MFDSVPFKKWPAFFLILIPFFVLAGQNQSENTSKTRLESWKNQARLTEDSPFKNMS